MILLTMVACGGGSHHSDATPTADAATPDAAVPDGSGAPALYTPRDDLTDDQLADQALALLGAPGFGSPNCSNCHGLTRQRLYNWRALSDTSLSSCLTDLDVSSVQSAQQMLDCLRIDPQDQQSNFMASKVGIFTAAAHLDWFDFTFRAAYGANFQAQYDEFQARVAMPQGMNHIYTQDELDIVATWVLRGLPLIDVKLPNDPPPTDCTPGVSAAVTAHVAEMANSGWRAVNAQNNILMHGCAGAQTVFDCLATYPRAGDQSFSQGWEVNVPGQQQRVLHTNAFETAYWTRSSADGRFVGAGTWNGPDSSVIVDLQRNFTIPASALYDPAFFPDNSGFVFQGGGAYLCNQSLLVSEPSQINFSSESQCARTNAVGLYEHVGAALGGDYWAIDGLFTSDDGGHFLTRSDPDTGFGSTSRARLTPIIHTGNNYQPLTTVRVDTPFEADAVLSPSSRMLISRLSGPNNSQLGFVMRQVIATPNGNTYTVEAPEAARYCISGGKPAFSYDERWLVIHHYVGDADAVELGFTGANDPGFAAYRQNGAANIYVVDTLNGDTTRITNMHAGQYALYPHFRSDGWIYFIVRTLGAGNEYIVASDAALRLEQ